MYNVDHEDEISQVDGETMKEMIVNEGSEPVKCADVPDLSKVVFRAEAPWQCKPEINMDSVVGDSKVLTARCRWNGTLSVSAECQNSDGCAGNRCGSRDICHETR